MLTSWFILNHIRLNLIADSRTFVLLFKKDSQILDFNADLSGSDFKSKRT